MPKFPINVVCACAFKASSGISLSRTSARKAFSTATATPSSLLKGSRSRHNVSLNPGHSPMAIPKSANCNMVTSATPSPNTTISSVLMPSISMMTPNVLALSTRLPTTSRKYGSNGTHPIHRSNDASNDSPTLPKPPHHHSPTYICKAGNLSPQRKTP